jgi:hypothetical protein
MNRRQTLGLLAMSGAGTLASRLECLTAAPAPPASWRLSWPSAATGRTVLKDVPADVAAAGPVLLHDCPATEAAAHGDALRRMIDDARAGLLAGVSCLLIPVDDARDLDWLRRVAAESGLPIVPLGGYHAPTELDALRQLDMLEAAGVDPRQIAVSVDRSSRGAAVRIAKRGSFVVVNPDTAGAGVAAMIEEAGTADRLLFSSGSPFQDTASAATVLGLTLIGAGIGERALRRILIDNPRTFLALVPAL